VGEIRRKLKACRVLGFFVIFWLCYNQTTNNNISQAGQEFQKGISNDTIQAFNLGIAAQIEYGIAAVKKMPTEHIRGMMIRPDITNKLNDHINKWMETSVFSTEYKG
jgi:dipeptide/tripeptide permease